MLALGCPFLNYRSQTGQVRRKWYRMLSSRWSSDVTQSPFRYLMQSEGRWKTPARPDRFLHQPVLTAHFFTFRRKKDLPKVTPFGCKGIAVQRLSIHNRNRVRSAVPVRTSQNGLFPYFEKEIIF